MQKCIVTIICQTNCSELKIAHQLTKINTTNQDCYNHIPKIMSIFLALFEDIVSVNSS